MRRTALTLLAAWPLAAFATQTSVDPETGLATWETRTHGIEVRLTQITPDQIRGFYQARGFPPEATERFARECVFMTVVRNVGDVTLLHRLANWRYAMAGQPLRPPRGKAAWDYQWRRLGVSESARIAFEWAQLPMAQAYAPGDWNQGMTSYSVPRGGVFDLYFAWQAGGRTHTGKLENVRCADENS
ncbi:MAG: hypothetical protein ACK4SR_01865 [Thiobacillus sp.]